MSRAHGVSSAVVLGGGFALTAMPCAGVLAQSTTPAPPTPTPIPLGGGLLGGAASYVPNIPLSPAAQANLAAQSVATGGDGTWQSQISYAHGMEFVTINQPQAPAWSGLGPSPFGPTRANNGRGAVAAPFAISRFEADGGLVSQFFTAVTTVRALGGTVPFASVNGLLWQNGFGQAGGFNWRTAAIFCNWLHNDRAITSAAFASGAYDVSTFGTTSGVFTDQLVASPGARFRLPTMDEWMMAGFYDASSSPRLPQDGQPAEPGPGLWWHWNTNDAVPQPGITTTTGTNQFGLGLYPNAQSPWGMMDMSGGRSEWLEDGFRTEFAGSRRIAGSSFSTNSIYSDSVTLHATTGDVPWFGGADRGIRIVMTIPAPSTGGVVLVGLLALDRRVRRGS